MGNNLKKIVVTGATSMIGGALIEVCKNNNIEVHAIIRPETKRQDRIIKDDNVHYHLSSLDELLNIHGLPSDCDVFYHFAWAGTDRLHRDDPEVQLQNIKYSLDSVKLAKKCGCSRYIGAGSQAEYGPCDSVIDENTIYNPVTAYGSAKYASSILCKKMCDKLGMDFVWGRICSVYGPHDNSNTMIMYAIDCFKRGETAIFSEGKQLWNYLYETDAGEIFFRLGDKSIPSDIYLVAAPDSRPLRTYVDTLIKLFPGDKRYSFAVNKNISLHNEKIKENKKIYSLNVNAKKTFNSLNFYPKISFDYGIQLVIDSVMS